MMRSLHRWGPRSEGSGAAARGFLDTRVFGLAFGFFEGLKADFEKLGEFEELGDFGPEAREGAGARDGGGAAVGEMFRRIARGRAGAVDENAVAGADVDTVRARRGRAEAALGLLDIDVAGDLDRFGGEEAHDA